MSRPPPPLNFIRSFEAAARHLSFTAAAKELGYTQAAISNHIRALEQYVGRPLFHRYPRSLKLTDIGEAFLPTLRQGLVQIDNATEAIVTSARNRTVIVACPMSLAETWLTGCLAGFAAAHPEVEIMVHGTVWEAPSDPIADLTITLDHENEVPQGAARLWPETLALVCAPALARRLTRPRDLAAMPRVFVQGRQEYWAIMGAALGLEGADLQGGPRTNGSNIALGLAVQGVGATVVPVSLARGLLAEGRLVEPFEARPSSPWSYHLRSTGLARNAAADRLAAWIAMQARGD